MKQLTLKQTVRNKAQKYQYDILDGTKVICIRRSNRAYVAAYVVYDKAKQAYTAPFFFSRTDLIGKGSSARIHPSEVYGVATLPNVAYIRPNIHRAQLQTGLNTLHTTPLHRTEIMDAMKDKILDTRQIERLKKIIEKSN